MVCFRVLPVLAAAVISSQQLSLPQTETPSPLLSIPPAATDTLRFGASLPDFEASDITGRLWRSSDLRGKLTVVDIWSTFPTNRGHSEIQRFYDKVKNSNKIQVLTFCFDHDYTHAAVYMKQKTYTFPVIADWVLTKMLFGEEVNLPQLWVIDREGRLSSRFRLCLPQIPSAAGDGPI